MQDQQLNDSAASIRRWRSRCVPAVGPQPGAEITAPACTLSTGSATLERRVARSPALPARAARAAGPLRSGSRRRRSSVANPADRDPRRRPRDDRSLPTPRPRRAAAAGQGPAARRPGPGAGGRTVQAGQEFSGRLPGRTRWSVRCTTTWPPRCPPSCGTPSSRRWPWCAPRMPRTPATGRGSSTATSRSPISPATSPPRRRPGSGSATSRSASRGPSSAVGLEIVDTPGVGGFNSVHGAATMAALPSADAVLMVSDASQEYTAPELEFLRQAITDLPQRGLCAHQGGPLSGVAAHRGDRQGPPEEAGIECPMFPVSSAVRWQPRRGRPYRGRRRVRLPGADAVPAQRVVGQADMLARRSTVNDVLAVTGQIVAGLSSEQSAQRNPEQVQELIGELTESQSRSAALKERSARWQQTLKDGVVDLNADIDHDLRDRMRDIVRLAEEEIDGNGDPTKIWEQLQRAGPSSRWRRRCRPTSCGRRSGRSGSPSRWPSTSRRTARRRCRRCAPSASDAPDVGPRHEPARRRAVDHRPEGADRRCAAATAAC